jgi:starch-binding outer membrane protein, SusD/RagB family
MQKTMKNILYLALFMVIGFSSCRKELLDPIPQTSISDAVAFQTPARAEQTVFGMYAAVKAGQFYGGRYPVYHEIRGEDFFNRTNNGVTGFQTYNYTLTPGTNEVANLWNTAYAAINRINVVIAGVQTAPLADSLKARYTAEARFLRALVYHSLVVMYARPYWDGNGDKPGVIIYTEPQTGSGGNQRPRSTVAQVYTLILEDLNFAETNLRVINGASVTRAHRNAAIALKTRVYLNMRRYADVITEANKIVSNAAPFTATSGVAHSLNASYVNLFRAGGNTTENVFSFPFTSLDLPGTQNSLNQYFSPAPGGNGDYAMNRTAGGILENTTEWRTSDVRRTMVDTIGGQAWLRKWTTNTDNVPVIRYSEVLLNLAEALARTNGLDTRAIAIVNAVRKRSDPTLTLAPTTAAELIQMILTERRIELLGEGLRSMDLMRLGLPLPTKPDVNSTVPTNDPQYIWPIPNSELLVNPVVQNPGY